MTTIDTASDIIDRLVPEDLMARMDQRAPGYDRDNTFFDEDFDELRATGFLDIAIPTEFGGHGCGLDAVAKAINRIARVAPATALAVNMHVYWTGVAADLYRQGDESCRFILEEAAKGKVFAALHGERGNDVPLFLSTTTAERADGGWTLNGHKIFGSLTPVWDYGGFHAMDSSDEADPRMVHGFLPREADGIEIVDTWDTIGMRATQSHDTILSDAFCPDRLVARVCPPGLAGADLFHVAIFAWGLTGLSTTYDGLARQAFDLIVETLPTKTSIALRGGSMAHHPEVQHLVAEMRMALDGNEALLSKVATDWATGVPHEDWPIRILSMRHRVINESFGVVDRALDLSGGAAAFKRNRLEQLFRDARMGRFHPGNTLLAHELVGKLSLGIDPDAEQRWG